MIRTGISTLALALAIVATPAAAQTAAEADAFVAASEKMLFDFGVQSSQVNWVNATYITEDTDAIAAGGYEKGWNDLRLQYQGIVPPVARDETKFDPGAKYHVPASVPYTRYFLARLLQFQFYEAACKQAGWKGPLHRCSFYGNKEVGAKLNAMLEMGQSKPWPDALEKFTGSRTMSGKAMVAYFAPLKKWLDVQNKGKPQGW